MRGLGRAGCQVLSGKHMSFGLPTWQLQQPREQWQLRLHACGPSAGRHARAHHATLPGKPLRTLTSRRSASGKKSSHHSCVATACASSRLSSCGSRQGHNQGMPVVQAQHGLGVWAPPAPAQLAPAVVRQRPGNEAGWPMRMLQCRPHNETASRLLLKAFPGHAACAAGDPNQGQFGCMHVPNQPRCIDVLTSSSSDPSQAT